MVVDKENDMFIKELQGIINFDTSDLNLYLLVFNILTDRNSLKNYSHNKRNILFDMNNIGNEKVNILKTKVDSYLNSKEKLKSLEDTREFLLKEMGLTMNTTFHSELNEIINTKNNVCTTVIQETYEIKEEDDDIDEDISKRKSTRMKKSIERYSGKQKYKEDSVYGRLNKTMTKFNRYGVRKNLTYEEGEINDIKQNYTDTVDIQSPVEEVKDKCDDIEDSEDEEYNENILQETLEEIDSDDLFGDSDLDDKKN